LNQGIKPSLLLIGMNLSGSHQNFKAGNPGFKQLFLPKKMRYE
jgi:hypothetical protein